MPPKKFVLEQCAIPQVWCGDSPNPPKKKKDVLTKYHRTGTRHECLKKGFGAGAANQRREDLPASSLRQIKYVSEAHEQSFAGAGIKTIGKLHSELKSRTTTDIEKLLKRILKKGKKVDQRAYNSVLVHLHQNGVGVLPACMTITIDSDVE